MLKRKQDSDKQLALLESKIHALEGSYLAERTDPGNVVQGYGKLLQELLPAPTPSASTTPALATTTSAGRLTPRGGGVSGGSGSGSGNGIQMDVVDEEEIDVENLTPSRRTRAALPSSSRNPSPHIADGGTAGGGTSRSSSRHASVDPPPPPARHQKSPATATAPGAPVVVVIPDSARIFSNSSLTCKSVSPIVVAWPVLTCPVLTCPLTNHNEPADLPTYIPEKKALVAAEKITSALSSAQTSQTATRTNSPMYFGKPIRSLLSQEQAASASSSASSSSYSLAAGGASAAAAAAASSSQKKRKKRRGW